MVRLLDRPWPRPIVQNQVGCSAAISPLIPARAKVAKTQASSLERQRLGGVSVDNIHQLTFNSFGQEYVYTFSGTTLCSGRPCATHLLVSITADGAQETKTLKERSDADGHYRFQVPFRAKPSQQIDFTITATSEDLLTAETSGRRILSDESQGTITRDLTLG
jgi:hypothetical protein